MQNRERSSEYFSISAVSDSDNNQGSQRDYITHLSPPLLSHSPGFAARVLLQVHTAKYSYRILSKDWHVTLTREKRTCAQEISGREA